MYGGMVALLVAFAFAENLTALLIADVLVDALGSSVTEASLPTVTFLLCGIYSFATGTSWGTMLVFFQPIVALAVYVYRDKAGRRARVAPCCLRADASWHQRISARPSFPLRSRRVRPPPPRATTRTSPSTRTSSRTS
jgi:hypothetical protein